jgi:cytosine/adenosine deaminase-related metal-dependent hydrolase
MALPDENSRAIYRARVVAPISTPPLDNGAVIVDHGLILRVGPFSEIRAEFSDMPVVDLGDSALMPGLINAHCHLDYTGLRGAISRPRSFAAWIERLNAVKRSLQKEDYLRAITVGLRQARHAGTTSLLNMEAFPELLNDLEAPPIRVWWFYEMIDIRLRSATDELIQGALRFFEQRSDWLGGFGINPHAPYTASIDLYRLASDCATPMGMLLSTHLAESREEYEMFRNATGPLFDFLRRLGRPMFDCGARTPFRHLAEAGAIDQRWILVHMNELDAEDLDFLSRGNRQWHIVHCPRSHAYFQHREFPIDELLARNVNISLGTDSLASNDSLSLWEEMSALQRRKPDLSSEQILRMVTVNPARAIGMHGRIGELAPGAEADMIAIPATAGPDSIYDELLSTRPPIDWMLIHGQPVS